MLIMNIYTYWHQWGHKEIHTIQYLLNNTCEDLKTKYQIETWYLQTPDIKNIYMATKAIT